MDVKLLYNPRDRKFRSVGEKMLEWEPCPIRGWVPRPPVEQPRRTGKKYYYSLKSGGQYVAVLFSLQLTSHTVKPFITLSNFRIKLEVYFSKELCPLVLIASLCFCMHMWMYGCDYTAQSESTFSGWRHRLLQHCSRSTGRGHTSPISLSRQRA